jgi:RNA polymerase sigma factor (sigma-70 family)
VAEDIYRTIEAVWRIESSRIVAGLVRLVRDIARAEELAQDAFIAAMEQWPSSGVPDNPGAWLMTAAKRRAVDQVRHNLMAERKHKHVAYELASKQSETAEIAVKFEDEDVGDERLSLMFTACHPVLSSEARVALTLRLLGGLSTEEIARAYLQTEATIAQRLVRAKKTLAKAKVPFDVPDGRERQARLASVLEVIYLVFNEGYGATSGREWVRATLCEEAVRLARILAELAPAEAEVHGLVALLEIQSSRLRARVDAAGRAVRLRDQTRASWDWLLIGRGLRALDRARSLGGLAGPYQLQAAIAACHATAPTVDATDWREIAALYSKLAAVMPSPVVELNRAVAVSMIDGPAAALAIVDALASDGTLADYHLLPAVRGDFLERLGRRDEARAAFEEAAGLTSNLAERELLLSRAREHRER